MHHVDLRRVPELQAAGGKYVVGAAIHEHSGHVLRAVQSSSHRIPPRDSASWMLVWMVRFERRECKRELARKGWRGSYLALDVDSAKCGLFRSFEQVAGFASRYPDVAVFVLQKMLPTVSRDEIEAGSQLVSLKH